MPSGLPALKRPEGRAPQRFSGARRSRRFRSGKPPRSGFLLRPQVLPTLRRPEGRVPWAIALPRAPRGMHLQIVNGSDSRHKDGTRVHNIISQLSPGMKHHQNAKPSDLDARPGRSGRGAIILAFVLCLGAPIRLPAAPPAWADAALPVTRNLELWLDAGRQPAAWQAHGKPLLTSDEPMDVWYDASGHERSLLQRAKSAQPHFLKAGAGDKGLVRFDGVDDHLTLSGQPLASRTWTVFLVAAPYANPGYFSAFLSFNETGKNDYMTGFNLDLGPLASDRFEVLNAEGPGFGGARDLLPQTYPFRETHVIEAELDGDANAVRLVVDGKPAGQRPFQAGTPRLDELALGARFYSNSAEPPFVSGFFHGHMAELLLYDAVLTEGELTQVRSYLLEKYRGLDAALARAQPGHRLEPVADPPPLQVLVPGFTVREIPIKLSNVNAVRYRSDGKLVALGYNGIIHLLSDTDGDGLEDRDEIFWDGKTTPTLISMALTPPGYARGRGVFVASKGKVSLILDTDGDDRGDREIVVATGWPLPTSMTGGVVDALGIALDRDGSIYFGLGADDFSNAYRVDPSTGQAAYRLESKRGTIQKVSPDFSRRETVCTGIRFPVGMAFNREGDLFCTDQEGATWLANGNPFDELLEIQPGRHYGFPPRHPRFLPNVIDEPSVFDYGPQHQSTCGLNFNEPVNGGPVFGPAWWRGDAIVAGESRGKLFRTRLVKTPSGYVARNQTIACLNLLTVDACPTPDGGLVVSTHGGQPDWGTGPNGQGRLFKITYTDRDHPQPVLAWAQSPREVRVAFDRTIEPSFLAGLKKQTRITAGNYVRAGDPFETMRPGYDAVQRQMAEPRFDLDILDAQVTPDRRTLVLTTPPQTTAAHYAITLPGMGRPAKPAPGQVPQHPRIDLDYDLSGAQTTWQPAGGSVHWSGWLPHFDLDVARALTAGSVEHNDLWSHIEKAGKLVLRCQLDLADMLRPAVQPGSKLDYTWPAETVFVTFQANRPLTVPPSKSPRVKIERQSEIKTILEVRPDAGKGGLVPVEIELATGPGTKLNVAWHTAEDARARPWPLRRILTPWATPDSSISLPKPDLAVPPELAGGNWGQGRRLFYSDQALCSQCHTIRGRGGHIGPDLSNLVYRDYASVLRDIQDPSAALNPDHLAFEITLTDGDSLVGTIRQPDAQTLIVGEGPGQETTLAKARVKSMRPLDMSIMPPGLDQLLGADNMKNLLTFLLTPPPRLRDYGPLPPPPPRTRAEVQAVLADATTASSNAAPRLLQLVLVAGAKDHGPGEHDYPAWQKAWSQLLSAADQVTVSTAWDWPSADQLSQADALIFFQHGDWKPQRARDLDAFLARGGGATFIHWAVDGGADPEGFAQRIGFSWKGGQSKFRHGDLDLVFPGAMPATSAAGFLAPSSSPHPVIRNFGQLHLHDESYWDLTGDPQAVSVLATGIEDGKPQPLMWTKEAGRGRVFVSIPGHFSWTFDDPLFRVLLLRGMAWTVREPVDRFQALATIGVDLKD
jgi:putative heme-binding domain-containing protein